MGFEQTHVDGVISRARFRRLYPNVVPTREEEFDAWLAEGHDALRVLDAHLARHVFLVGDAFTLADIALAAYTDAAEQGGFERSRMRRSAPGSPREGQPLICRRSRPDVSAGRSVVIYNPSLVKRSERQTTAALKALGEPRRVEILRLLRGGPRAVGEIAAEVDVSQQAVSQHLAILDAAGLVEARKVGTRSVYAIRPDGFAPVEDFARSFWTARLETLKDDIEKKR